MINAPGLRAEMLGGQQFTRPERTPLLSGLVDGAQAQIESALRKIARDATVLRDADLLLSSQAVAIPDLAVYRGPTHEMPDLVIEYRAESTDRLFFGPKRLAYGRARIAEVWFVDASKTTITALRLGPGIDYPWPAQTYGAGDEITSAAIFGLVIPASVLLGSARQS